VTALELMIRDEIRAGGPMRFDRYMGLALHHPQHGYYVGGGRIGREGDFFTSVSVGPLFGRLLARQAAQMWRLLGCPYPFWIVEQGAHDGQLAVDILKASRADAPDFFRSVRYEIIEPSLAARKAQEQRVAGADLAVAWGERFGNDEKPAGLFLSNELVDSFPVRLVRRHLNVWQERHVGLAKDETFLWNDLPVMDPELVRAVEELPCIEGYATEINLAARSWMAKVAKCFRRGYVLTIDYGFPASVYYAPFRINGTLTTYRNHRRGDDVLLAPGECDLTAHVDFTALARAGGNEGLTALALLDQQHFLMGVAHDELSGAKTYADGIAGHLHAWNTLTHPGHLGSRFQVLVQARYAPAELDGLRYARGVGLD
jgi:SAM-dependent MidA family methyltransferase